MNNIRILIGQILLIGIIISLLLIISGGIMYLWQHGNDIVNYQNFSPEPVLLTSLPNILAGAFSMSPGNVILLGLLTLFLMQILRVALTMWYFIKEKSTLFCGISFLILFVLLATLFWNF